MVSTVLLSLPRLAHPASSNCEVRGSSLAACLSQNCFVYSYFLMLGNNWNKQELFPSYQYIPVPNNITAIQLVSRRNSTPKTPGLIL